MARIKSVLRTTYTRVTPESAEQGDAAERGWIDAKGVHLGVVEMARALVGCEPSASEFQRGIWYTRHNYHVNYATGANESRAYHLSGYTEAHERRVYAIVTGK